MPKVAFVLLSQLIGLTFANKFVELTKNQTQQWMTIPYSEIKGQPTFHLGAGTCLMGSIVYIYGGVKSTATDDFFAFDLETMSFSQIFFNKSLPSPGVRYRHFLLASEEENALYLMGGKGDDISPWKYEIKSSTWSPLSDANYISDDVQGTDYAVANTPSYLIAAGSDNGKFSEFLAYVKHNDTWIKFPGKGPTAREDAAMIRIGDIVYFIGGGTATEHHPNTSSFIDTSLPLQDFEWSPMPGISGEEFHGFSIGSLIGVLADKGGKGDLATTSGMALFNTSDKNATWNIVTKGSTWIPGLHLIMIVAYKNKVVLMGGATGDGVVVDRIYVYDYKICEANCNYRGSCVLGSCACSGKWTGATCEVDLSGAQVDTALVTGIVVGGSVAIFLLLVVVWRLTANTRKYRRLYSTSKLAEDMAFQIANMDLDSLSYLKKIEKPNSVQKNFMSIIESLQVYKRYLPETILEEIGDNNSQRSEPVSSNSGEETLKSNVSITSADQVCNNKPVIQKNYEYKLCKKEVSILQVAISMGGIMESRTGSIIQSLTSQAASFEMHYTEMIDKIHTAISETGGSVLRLEGNTVIGAWNFTRTFKRTSASCSMSAALAITSTHFVLHRSVTKRLGYVGFLGGSRLRSPALIGNHFGVAATLLNVAERTEIPVTTDLRELSTHFLLTPVDIVFFGSYTSLAGGCYSTSGSIDVFSATQQTSVQGEWMYELSAIGSHAAIAFRMMDFYRANGADLTLTEIDAQRDKEIFQRLKQSIVANRKPATKIDSAITICDELTSNNSKGE